METDFKREAIRQYLRYFRFWFLAIVILAVIVVAVCFIRPKNHAAPAERVYDYADVLAQGEEEELRRYIREKEEELRIHIVLVTISQSVEGTEARERYDYRYTDWERNMQDLADDFWDDNRYGYNRGFEGDGVLLLHNWYPGQNGEQLSTSGRVEHAFSSDDIDSVFDAVDAYYESSPYKAYRAYVDQVCSLMSVSSTFHFSWGLVLILPLVTAGIYASCNLRQKKAENTTRANAYVAGGRPVMKEQEDNFLRKNVITRKIETSSSGGSYHRSGGGGHHYSRSGASHGGGSRRH